MPQSMSEPELLPDTKQGRQTVGGGAELQAVSHKRKVTASCGRKQVGCAEAVCTQGRKGGDLLRQETKGGVLKPPDRGGVFERDEQAGDEVVERRGQAPPQPQQTLERLPDADRICCA